MRIDAYMLLKMFIGNDVSNKDVPKMVHLN